MSLWVRRILAPVSAAQGCACVRISPLFAVIFLGGILYGPANFKLKFAGDEKPIAGAD